MRHGDVMQDRFYAGIVFEIEQTINKEDQIALSRGIVLTDSQVISVLTKVLGVAQGKPAKMPVTSNPRDEVLAELCEKLKEVRRTTFVTEAGEGPEAAKPLPTVDWVKAVRCVIESARMRKGSVPASRYYLDFLGPFIAQASGR